MWKSSSIPAGDLAILEDSIRQASRIGIVPHTRPDGDAVGSSLAMRRFITECFDGGKEVRILLDTDMPDAVRFLLTQEEKEQTLVCEKDKEAVAGFLSACDLLIFPDLNQISRCGEIAPLLRDHDARRILIDHHPAPDTSAFDLLFSETEVSSTCELLYHILVRLAGLRGVTLPKSCLDPLLTGITTDTNNFANSVFSMTLETVSELLEAGADRDTILAHIYESYPERRIRLMGWLLDRELVITEQGVAYMILDDDCAKRFGILEGETEGFVNLPLAVDRVKMSLFLRQNGDEFRVSIRSKKGWSAQRLARGYFEGGGHEQASGGKLRMNDKAEAAAWIERCLKDYLAHEQ